VSSKVEKIVLYEGMSPRGHVELTKFYHNSLKSLDSQLYVGKSLKDYFPNTQNVNFFDDELLLKGKYFSRFFFILNTLKLYIYCHKEKVNKVVFLSYNANVMFVLMWIASILRLKVYCFEHNTVPSSSKIKAFLQKLCTKRLVRMCFMPDAVNFYKNLNLTSIYIPHPFLNVEILNNIKGTSTIKEQGKYSRLVFCPSGQSDINRIINRAKENPDVFFLVKSKEKIDVNNIKAIPYLDNYYETLKSCDLVYLPIDFDFRVSGPFFESIAFGKPVFIDGDGLFTQYALSEFRNCIVNNFNVDSTNSYKIDYEACNQFVRSKLLRVISR